MKLKSLLEAHECEVQLAIDQAVCDHMEFGEGICRDARHLPAQEPMVTGKTLPVLTMKGGSLIFVPTTYQHEDKPMTWHKSWLAAGALYLVSGVFLLTAITMLVILVSLTSVAALNGADELVSYENRRLLIGPPILFTLLGSVGAVAASQIQPNKR